MEWNSGDCGAGHAGGSSVINCISVLCAILRQITHLNFTALLSLLAFSTQYFRLDLAVVVATPGCPQLCMWLMIKRDILLSLGSSAGRFSSYDTIALSILSLDWSLFFRESQKPWTVYPSSCQQLHTQSSCQILRYIFLTGYVLPLTWI